VSCANVNECTTGQHNCDVDAVCSDTDGSFSCACRAGRVGSGTACQCDMTGTFATLTELDIAWDPVSVPFFGNVLDGGTDTTFAYSLRRYTQNGASLDVAVTACGGTTNDVCSTFFGEAYSQYQLETIWQGPQMPTMLSTLTLNDPDPTETFTGPAEAVLLGLDLANDFGTWPTSHTSSSITWLDHDNDGPLGVTSFVRTSGRSVACDLPYAPLPIGVSGTATKLSIGTRSRATMIGRIDSCSKVTGTLGGPGTGNKPVFDGRIHSCTLSGPGASPCTAANVNEIDGQLNSATQRVLNGRFTMVKVPAAATCAQVRACFENNQAQCPITLPF
jgi:hypothetical protein